jgi:dTDP-glucose 4,6-dehydratase
MALQHNARFILASTSEVYGDPEVHPQPESYWGHVSCTGPRSVYDEAKRFAEALTMAYRRSLDVNTGIIRIFNTYGPRMRQRDGRVIPTFLRQAMCNEPLVVFGDGSQTRCFCYIDDLVEGITRFTASEHPGPVNLGNSHEISIIELAQRCIEAVPNCTSDIVHGELPTDDPKRRRPDTTLASDLLAWAPKVALQDGLRRCVQHLDGELNAEGATR